MKLYGRISSMGTSKILQKVLNMKSNGKQPRGTVW